MKIAAGVLIIIVALLDLGAGILYGLGGAVASGAGEIGQQMQAEIDKQEQNMTAEQSAELEKGLGKVKEAGGMLGVLGMAFFVLFGLAIAAGVVLFMEKAAIFVMVVGVLQVLADGASMAFVGPTIWNILGIAVAALVVTAAISYKDKQPLAPMPDAPPVG